MAEDRSGTFAGFIAHKSNEHPKKFPVAFGAARWNRRYDGPYAFTGLLGDVQFWLGHPTQNFGWILISEDEATPYTSRRIGSRESGGGPTLDLEYIPRPFIEHSRRIGNQFSLSFLAQADQRYSVQCRDSRLDDLHEFAAAAVAHPAHHRHSAGRGLAAFLPNRAAIGLGFDETADLKHI